MATSKSIIVDTVYVKNADPALGGGFNVDVIGNDKAVNEYLSEYVINYISASIDMPSFVEKDIEEISPFNPKNFDDYKKSVLNKIDYLGKDIEYLYNLINSSSDVNEYKKIMNDTVYKKILDRNKCLLEKNDCNDHMESLLSGKLIKIKIKFDGINEKLVNFLYFKVSNSLFGAGCPTDGRKSSQDAIYEMASASQPVSANASVKTNRGGDVKIKLLGGDVSYSWVDGYDVDNENCVAETTASSIKRNDWKLKVGIIRGSYQTNIAGWRKI